MTKIRLRVLAASTLLGLVLMPNPASAAPTVYTNQAAFQAAIGGGTTYGFTYTENEALPPVVTNGPATFAGALGGYDDVYGVPYLGDYFGPLSVTSTALGIGLFLGSYNGPETVTYSFAGLTGQLAVPRRSTTFIGFTNDTGPLSINFTNSGELDTTGFIAGDAGSAAAVPEPAAWALMLVGLGAVGAASRYRRTKPSASFV